MEEVCWLKYERVQRIKRMNEINRKVLKHYQIRKTRKQKEEFRKFLVDELKQYEWIMLKNMMRWYLISRLVLQSEKKRK